MNKKGFTLVETIAAITVLAIVTTIGILAIQKFREMSIERQYINLKTKIENAAEKYAAETSIITMTVAKLVDDGYITSEDGKVIDPRNDDLLNCNMVKVKVQHGQYDAEMEEESTEQEDGSCAPYVIMTENSVDVECISNNCDENFFETGWYKGTLKLKPNNIIENIKSVRWTSTTGFYSENTEVDVETTSLLSSIYTMNLTFEDNSTGTHNKLIQIDNEKPIIVEVTKDDRWSNKDKDVMVSATDGAGSGINGYYVGTTNSCPASGFQESNEFKLSEGTYYACSIDNVGNISEPYEFIVENFDKISPTGSAYSTNKSTMGITYYSKLIREINYSDGESGIDKVKYCFTTGSACEPDITAGIIKGKEVTATFEYPTNKNSQRVCSQAIDNVGNKSDVKCDSTFKVDKTKPTNVSIAPSTVTNVLNISAKDNESAINKYVCYYGTSSNNLNKTVTVNSSSTNSSCELDGLNAGITYYFKVEAYNNANLVTTSEIGSMKANITSEEAYKVACGNSTYCNKEYYVDYSGETFAAYSLTSTGIRLVSMRSTGPYVYQQTSCCNNGQCNYSGSNYTNGILANSLNTTFLSSLSNYSAKLNRMLLHTGYKGAETTRTASAYVGVMNYVEWNNTKNFTNLLVNDGKYNWLVTATSSASYVTNYIVNGNQESSAYVNSAGAYARPTIELKKNVVFVSGDGSKAKPFKVV